MSHEERIAKISSKIMEEAFACEQLPIDAAQRRMQELEAVCVAQFSDDQLILNLRRSVAQHLFRRAMRGDLPLAISKEQFNNRNALGYSHITHKCSNVVILARLCIHASAKRDAVQLVEAILEEMGPMNRDKLAEQMYQETQEFLTEIKQDKLSDFA